MQLPNVAPFSKDHWRLLTAITGRHVVNEASRSPNWRACRAGACIQKGSQQGGAGREEASGVGHELRTHCQLSLSMLLVLFVLFVRLEEERAVEKAAKEAPPAERLKHAQHVYSH